MMCDGVGRGSFQEGRLSSGWVESDPLTKGSSVISRVVPVLAACVLLAVCGAGYAAADPEPEPVAADAPSEPLAEAAPPMDDGRVVSAPPATTTSPDGWVLTVSAKDETQLPVAPLTTALSSRDYIVGGTFNGALSGPEEAELPHGILEVGYQVGCGIDMSTSNGVTLTGSAGITPSLALADTGLVPAILTPVSGGIAIGLKPGIINVVPVTKKEYEGYEPWVMISGFHVKIDGCVGQSFIRSYATFTRSTDLSDAILSYYGETKVV